MNNPNPMHDVEIPKGRPAGETYAYSLEEEALMLTILPDPAATVVATAAFTGARKGELRGLMWENYDGSQIRVMKSVWRSHVEEAKRPKSRGAIPVVAQLKTLPERHRGACGNPSGGFVFANANGKPMNLDALARDVIQPTLEMSGLDWHGWHAFRRGLATNLHRPGVSDKSDPADTASRERHHDDEHLCEDGEQRRSGRDENPGNHVCNYCATNAPPQYTGDVENALGPQLARLCAGTNYGNLAEREGFEPSIQVLARITV